MHDGPSRGPGGEVLQLGDQGGPVLLGHVKPGEMLTHYDAMKILLECSRYDQAMENIVLVLKANL